MSDERRRIYTITTLSALPSIDPPTTEETRCVGWFAKVEDAREAVARNLGDMFEAGAYPYAVIEEVGEGLYQTELEYELYRWEPKRDGYVRTDVPESMRHIAVFGIG